MKHLYIYASRNDPESKVECEYIMLGNLGTNLKIKLTNPQQKSNNSI